MSGERTDQDVLEERITTMGPELGPLFHALSNELTWVHWRWNQYRILFGTNPDRIDFLNESAGFFFYVVQESLFEDTLLGIARLVGPPNSVGKPNLTLRRLTPLLQDQALRDEVDEFMRKAGKGAEFAVDCRHRHVAHRNLDLALGRGSQSLPSASRQQVEDALAALRDVLNCIDHNLCKSVTAYSHCVALGDAEVLLALMWDGVLRQRDRQARWNQGELHEDDLKAPQHP